MASDPAAFPDPGPARLPLPVLVGDRVHLRALCAGDAPAVQRHADEAQVARWLHGGFPQPYTAAHAEDWCTRGAASGLFGYVWGITDSACASPQEVVGCIGVLPQSGWLACNAEVGYWLGRSRWGQGLATDALRQVTDWAFAALPVVTRLAAPILAGNGASQAVAAKCGYVCEGTMRRSALKDGRAVDRMLWAAYRPDRPVRPADLSAAARAAEPAPHPESRA